MRRPVTVRGVKKGSRRHILSLSEQVNLTS